MPGDQARANQLLAVREAVPAAVNQRVGRAKRTIDARIEKTAADMIVPFDRLEELLTVYETGFGTRGLDAAIWGHISDGNLHPERHPAIAGRRRTPAKRRSSNSAAKRSAWAARRSPSTASAATPVKQQLLEQLYGKGGIDDMRAVKRAIDPDWKLAPGVLFSRT